jgi:hypothetical protein
MGARWARRAHADDSIDRVDRVGTALDTTAEIKDLGRRLCPPYR